MRIFGAGLAGLLAGCHFQRAEIYEASEPRQNEHKALLRFRTPSVGESVGIEFKSVQVHKTIWVHREVSPSPRWCNMYSQKVTHGSTLDRSIWSLDPVQRYIAPEDFICQLIDRCSSRIHWGFPVGKEQLEEGEPTISTIPMFVWADKERSPKFDHAPIRVNRYRVDRCNVYQTIYYPSFHNNLYRASITGDLLIAEFVDEPNEFDFSEMLASFGLSEGQIEPLESAHQRFGKIVPVDDQWRRNFIYNLTQKHNMYSLGRFATWRNVLLDDVLHDITVIKRLHSCSEYELLKRR